MSDEHTPMLPCYPEAQALVCKSPRLALARAWDVDFVPFVFIVTGTFSTSGAASALLGLQPSKALERDLLITAIDVDIQNPNFNPGDEFKPQADWYYDSTSGIQTRWVIDGYNKRSSPYFPLKALPKCADPRTPWTFLEEQQLTLDFTVTTGLTAAGIVVTATFVSRTPADDSVFRMSSKDAFDNLDALGYFTKTGRKFFGCS